MNWHTLYKKNLAATNGQVFFYTQMVGRSAIEQQFLLLVC
jgi:hypothetical protein